MTVGSPRASPHCGRAPAPLHPVRAADGLDKRLPQSRGTRTPRGRPRGGAGAELRGSVGASCKAAAAAFPPQSGTRRSEPPRSQTAASSSTRNDRRPCVPRRRRARATAAADDGDHRAGDGDALRARSQRPRPQPPPPQHDGKLRPHCDGHDHQRRSRSGGNSFAPLRARLLRCAVALAAALAVPLRAEAQLSVLSPPAFQASLGLFGGVGFASSSVYQAAANYSAQYPARFATAAAAAGSGLCGLAATQCWASSTSCGDSLPWVAYDLGSTFNISSVTLVPTTGYAASLRNFQARSPSGAVRLSVCPSVVVPSTRLFVRSVLPRRRGR